MNRKMRTQTYATANDFSTLGELKVLARAVTEERSFNRAGLLVAARSWLGKRCLRASLCSVS